MYISRTIENTFQKRERVYSIIAVVGARQSGKTTFLKEQSKSRKAIYLLFDDPDVRALFEEDIKKFERQYLEGMELSVLDEVQYCINAGIKLKYLCEQGKKLWITSSSEILLSKEILSYLVGRVSIVKMYPFSLSEFFRAQGQKEMTKSILKRIIWEHAQYGGYPKVVLTPELELKRTILRDLYETMILKDIAKTFSIEDIKTLEECSRYLAINTGAIASYDSIASILKISFPTIKKYLEAMEKSYLIIRITPFFVNKNKEISKQPKIYFIDTGLRNAIAGSFSGEMDGKIFENYVLSELVKKGFIPKYWRTKSGTEVDFVIEKEGEMIPVEVKLAVEGYKIEKSLHSFIEIYKPKRAFIIFYEGTEKDQKRLNCAVHFTDVKGLIEKL